MMDMPYYPKNGLQMQEHYPNFTNAPKIGFCHGGGMSELPFDRDLVRKRLREMKITQTQMARDIGFTSQSAVSNLLTTNPNKQPRKASAEEAAAIYEYLRMEMPPRVQIVPIIGLASAGNWREAIQMPAGEMAVPPGRAGNRSFAVEVKGDSMDLYVPDGGYAVIDPDKKMLFNRKAYLIENEEHEVTIKRYRTDPARYEPVSNNPEHQPIFVGGMYPVVIGQVVWRGLPD